ncbi:MAG: peroxiredoxin family protein [Hyphomonadaceae bacterium]
MIVAVFAMVGVASAQTHNYGPAIGDVLPSFSAQDQSGATRSAVNLNGPNGVVLLVTRSADWCPFCQAQLIGLESIRRQIEARGWRLAAITTDTSPELARFANARGIGFTMLSDEPAQIVRQLDLLDPTQPPNSRHNGLPVPTIIFVSANGIVRAKLGDANYRVRPSTEIVLQTLDGLR